jgi:hypothetical protein
VLDTLVTLGSGPRVNPSWRRSRLLAVAFVGLLFGPGSAFAAILSPQDKAVYESAFSLADGEQWPTAIREADAAKDPVLRDVILWQFMQQPNSGSGDLGAVVGQAGRVVYRQSPLYRRGQAALRRGFAGPGQDQTGHCHGP